jgi:hypothetical protein
VTTPTVKETTVVVMTGTTDTKIVRPDNRTVKVGPANHIPAQDLGVIKYSVPSIPFLDCSVAYGFRPPCILYAQCSAQATFLGPRDIVRPVPSLKKFGPSWRTGSIGKSHRSPRPVERSVKLECCMPGRRRK